MGILTDFRLSVLEENLGVYGIHLHQKGKTIAEHRFRSDDRINLCSASKIFVAVAIGIAEFEKALSVDNYVMSYFPELQEIASEGSETITIKHLLNMTSGHSSLDYTEFTDDDGLFVFLKQKVTKVPGEEFFYEDLCSYVLGRIIEKVYNEELLVFLRKRLFDDLSIINPQWHTCILGHTACSGGLFLTTEEFSRIGILLLNNGCIYGKQILSKDFIERMYSDLIDTSYKLDKESQQGYGYQVWRCTLPNTYRADGMYGQYCIILSDYEAVVTITGHNENNPKDTIRAIWRDIVPKL